MENKTSKYFKYAIGEIILVVIGILIALQINNWNEQRKRQNTEKEILVDLRESLQSDLDAEIIPKQQQLKLDIQNINAISKAINQDLPWNDSLSTKFKSLVYRKNIKWEVSSYMALENEGVNIISNQVVKDAIITIYNSSYPDNKNYLTNFMNNLMSFYRPNMRERFLFNYEKSSGTYTPLDFEATKKDHIFINTVQTAHLNFVNISIAIDNLRTEVEKTISLINDELNNLK